MYAHAPPPGNVLEEKSKQFYYLLVHLKSGLIRGMEDFGGSSLIIGEGLLYLHIHSSL